MHVLTLDVNEAVGINKAIFHRSGFISTVWLPVSLSLSLSHPYVSLATLFPSIAFQEAAMKMPNFSRNSLLLVIVLSAFSNRLGIFRGERLVFLLLFFLFAAYAKLVAVLSLKS